MGAILVLVACGLLALIAIVLNVREQRSRPRLPPQRFE
jgi:hypothetical protein